jgi:hypothetical protein
VGLDVRPEILEVLRKNEEVVPDADLVAHVPVERRLQFEAELFEYLPRPVLGFHHLRDDLLQAGFQGVQEKLVRQDAPYPVLVKLSCPPCL